MKKISFALALLLTASCSQSQTYTVTLAGYNYTDRPISGYSVNGASGGNMFAGQRNGGSGWACCAKVTVGKNAHIEWTFSRTKDQYKAGIPIENHDLDVVVPASTETETETPRYLEVHFYSNKRVQLRLVRIPGDAQWPVGTDTSKLE